jgi:hypothetical protein
MNCRMNHRPSRPLGPARPGMRRAMLEVVATGAVSTTEDIRCYVRCTLLAAMNSYEVRMRRRRGMGRRRAIVLHRTMCGHRWRCAAAAHGAAAAAAERVWPVAGPLRSRRHGMPSSDGSIAAAQLPAQGAPLASRRPRQQPISGYSNAPPAPPCMRSWLRPPRPRRSSGCATRARCWTWPSFAGWTRRGRTRPPPLARPFWPAPCRRTCAWSSRRAPLLQPILRAAAARSACSCKRRRLARALPSLATSQAGEPSSRSCQLPRRAPGQPPAGLRGRSRASVRAFPLADSTL